jgi:hypothetical protein
LKFSGWVSLIANVIAITGFLIDHWPSRIWRPNPGFWVVLSFVTTAYTLVIWSILTWRRSMRGVVARQPGDNHRSGLFLLNAMAVLPALTAWLFLVLSALNDPVITSTMGWILALAIAWAGTPFLAIGLTWTGATLGALLFEHFREQ